MDRKLDMLPASGARVNVAMDLGMLVFEDDHGGVWVLEEDGLVCITHADRVRVKGSEYPPSEFGPYTCLNVEDTRPTDTWVRLVDKDGDRYTSGPFGGWRVWFREDDDDEPPGFFARLSGLYQPYLLAYKDWQVVGG